jgi:hypothetical protein
MGMTHMVDRTRSGFRVSILGALLPLAFSPAAFAEEPAAPVVAPQATPAVAQPTAEAAPAPVAESTESSGVLEESAPAETLAEETQSSPLAIHAFVSQGFLKTTKNNYLGQSSGGSFDFTEVGINFTKGLTEDLRVGMQLFARDLGRIGNYKPTFDWYYLDYHFKDWLGFRAGRTKIPFGLYNETSDIDSARVPAFLPQSVYPVQNRDYLLAQTGGEIYGFVPAGDIGSLEYRGYGGTIFLDTSTSNSAAGSISDFRVPYLIGGRLMWLTPIRGLQVGGSLQALRLDFDVVPSAQVLGALEPDDFPDGFNGTVKARIPALLWVGSLEYTTGDLLLATEFSRWRVKLESTLPALYQPTKMSSDRFYVMGSYRLAPWFAPGAYYSMYFPKSGEWDQRKDYQHDVAFTARFDVNQYWLLKAEAHIMHGTALLSPTENQGKLQNDLVRDWGLFVVKTTVYF